MLIFFFFLQFLSLIVGDCRRATFVGEYCRCNDFSFWKWRTWCIYFLGFGRRNRWIDNVCRINRSRSICDSGYCRYNWNSRSGWYNCQDIYARLLFLRFVYYLGILYFCRRCYRIVGKSELRLYQNFIHYLSIISLLSFYILP